MKLETQSQTQFTQSIKRTRENNLSIHDELYNEYKGKNKKIEELRKSVDMVISI